MQIKLSSNEIINDKGYLNEVGYSTSFKPVFGLDKIKNHHNRIGKFLSYSIGDEHNNLFIKLIKIKDKLVCNVTFTNFVSNKSVSKTDHYQLDDMDCSFDLDKDFIFKTKKTAISIINEENKKHLRILLVKFDGEKDLRADIYLFNRINSTFFVAIPFKEQSYFSTSHISNLLITSGYVKCGEDIYDLNSAYSLIRFDLGVYPRRHDSYWANINLFVDKKPLCLNLGYGHNELPPITENYILDGEEFLKLNDSHFDVQFSRFGSKDILKPWKIRNGEDTIKLTFTPFTFSKSNAKILSFKNIDKAIYGYFNGSVLVDGKYITIDKKIGFIKKTQYRW